MTVYVDDAAIPTSVPNGSVTHTSTWSHLTADTKDELHAFAVGKLGLKKSYFQDKPRGLWHYDVTKSKRDQALRLGAVPMPYGQESFDLVWHKPGREGWDGPAPDAAVSQPAEPAAEQVTDPRRPVGWINGFPPAKPEFVLSNFGPGSCTVDGVGYPSGEHGFNAAKSLDSTIRAHILMAATPREAKRLGSKGGIADLRPDWDKRVRYEVMDQVIASKFAAGTEAAAFLLGTGDELLIESNSWHDTHWGHCTCEQHRAWPGRNELGLALMRQRELLRAESGERWVRVMCTGHRDQYMTAEQRAWVDEELARVAAKLIAERGMRVAIHGGANGADLAWAKAADRAGVDSLWAYLPYPNQTRGWSEQQKTDWAYCTSPRSAGGAATKRWTLGDAFDVRLLHARNDAMIRDAQAVVAVHDPAKTTGGTASALKTIGGRLPVIALDIRNRTVKIRRNLRMPGSTST